MDDTQKDPTPVDLAKQPALESKETVTNETAVKSSPNMMMIIPIIVIIVAIAAGAFWFISTGRTSQFGQATPPLASPNPASTQSGSLDQQINAIDIQTIDSDFQAVDKDLKNL